MAWLEKASISLTFKVEVSSGNRFNVATVFSLFLVAGVWLSAEMSQSDNESDEAGETSTDLRSADLFEQQRQASAPVAWTLFATDQSLVYPQDGYAAEIMQPLRPLYMGNVIEVPEGQEISVLIPSNMSRRHFTGPATLLVIKDTISIRKGPKARVFPADPDRLKWVRNWSATPWLHQNTSSNSSESLTLLEPENKAVLLTTKPVFKFRGPLPRDGQLIVFNENGRRFWVQPLASHTAEFPPAARFEWGQRFTWELRKSTGGRVLSGAFEIASEELAFQLLNARVPNLPGTPKEDLLFYGVQLELARAFKEADRVWQELGAHPHTSH